MINPANADVGCHLVGEYEDEAELPTNLAFKHGEVVRPKVVGSYQDLWSKDDPGRYEPDKSLRTGVGEQFDNE